MYSIVHFQSQSVEGNIFYPDNFHLIDTFVIGDSFPRDSMQDFLRVIEIHGMVSILVRDDYHIDDSIESLNKNKY